MRSRNINHTHSYRIGKIMILSQFFPLTPPVSIAEVMKWKWKIRATENQEKQAH